MMVAHKRLYVVAGIALILSLLSCACQGNQTVIISDIHKEVKTIETTAMETLNMSGQNNISVPYTAILEETECDFINSIVWVNEQELLLDCIQEVDDQYRIKWYIYHIQAGMIQLLHEYTDDNFYSIRSVYEDQNILKISQFNGSYFEFHDRKLVKQANGSDSELTAYRDLASGNLYYYDYENQCIYNQSTSQSVYTFNEASKEIVPMALQLSSDNEKLAFACVTPNMQAARTVIVDLKKNRVNQFIKLFMMPAYFWIGDQLFVVESGNDDSTSSRVCYADNFERELSIQYDIKGTGFAGTGYLDYNTGLNNLGGNGTITPLSFDYQTGLGERTGTIAIFSMKAGTPQLKSIYHATNRMYSNYTVSPSGKYLAFREFSRMEAETLVDNIVILRLNQ